jgi:hypothetical protein
LSPNCTCLDLELDLPAGEVIVSHYESTITHT